MRICCGYSRCSSSGKGLKSALLINHDFLSDKSIIITFIKRNLEGLCLLLGVYLVKLLMDDNMMIIIDLL